MVYTMNMAVLNLQIVSFIMCGNVIILHDKDYAWFEECLGIHRAGSDKETPKEKRRKKKNWRAVYTIQWQN